MIDINKIKEKIQNIIYGNGGVVISNSSTLKVQIKKGCNELIKFKEYVTSFKNLKLIDDNLNTSDQTDLFFYVRIIPQQFSNTAFSSVAGKSFKGGKRRCSCCDKCTCFFYCLIFVLICIFVIYNLF